MIAYLKGTVLRLEPGYAVLLVNGIGYEVSCSGAAFSRLSAVKKGEEGAVFTYLQVKEDGMTLYGFADEDEKSLFLKLTSVQGVGAKLALSILSSMRPVEVSEVIATADLSRLSKVKGIGKKTAERILLELHGKITAGELLSAEAKEKTAFLPVDEEAVNALTGLGFTRQESVRAVERAKSFGAETVEQILSAALKGM